MLVGFITLYAMAFTVRVVARKHYLFLQDYLRNAVTAVPAAGPGPTHIFLLFVDHFEPDSRPAQGLVTPIRRLVASTRQLGRPGTGFYPDEQSSPAFMRRSAKLPRRSGRG
jgi:hypothetical protein